MDAERADFELLEAYARNGDEQAFRQIVDRYAALVYSAALRQVGPTLAEDVTQSVFFILAQKARKVEGATLAGWLVKAARLTGLAAYRNEHRRQKRELRAAAMQPETTSTESPDGEWSEIAPLLDAAMAKLNDKDRSAITLRYLQGKSIDEIALTMRTSSYAASKRTNRALEKLRSYFANRGLDLTGETIGKDLAVHGIVAVPMTLMPKLATIGATAGIPAAAAPIVSTTFSMIAAAKAKIAAAIVVGAVVVAGTSAVVVSELKSSANAKAAPVAAVADEIRTIKYTAEVRTEPDPTERHRTAEDWNLKLEPEQFTRYPTPDGQSPTFEGKIVNAQRLDTAEIGIVSMRGVQWLTTANYQWAKVNADGTFKITAQKFPGVPRVLVARAKGQAATFFRQQFDPTDSAKDIVLRMAESKPVQLVVEDSKGKRPSSFKIEVFQGYLAQDNDGNNLEIQRLDAPMGSNGQIKMDLPLEPVSLLFSGKGIAQHFQTVDPREAERFEFKLLAPVAIRGTLTRDGVPVAGEKVYASNAAGPLSAVIKKTDSKGHFQITDGLPGIYNIGAAGSQMTVEIGEGETKEVKFELKSAQTSDSSQ